MTTWWAHARDALATLPTLRLGEALLLTLAAYAVLPGYDLLAFRSLRRRVHLGLVVAGSLLSYAISHTLGFALVTGGSVRLRFWRRAGLSLAESGTALGVIATGFAMGLVLALGLALLLEPAESARALHLTPGWATGIGTACLAAVGGYLLLTATGRRAVRVWKLHLQLPRLGPAAAGLLVALLDWTLAAAAFAVLLPGGGVPFPVVLAAFVVAQSAGLLSHLPGGVGAFDAVTVALLAPLAGTAPVLAALLGFRVLYYLLPFAIGALALTVTEMAAHRARIARGLERAGWIGNVLVTRWIPAVLPTVLGVLVFAAGAVLLFSGATPPVHGRMLWLRDAFPLGVIELSHFAASVVGGGLMVVGWALTRRLDAAWRAAQGLLLIGIAGSLLKGLDWEEALALGAVLALLAPSRRAFYRRAALSTVPFSIGWLVAILAVLGATVWLGTFSWRHVQYSSELWWQFTWHRAGDAPRYLRATVGVLATLSLVALARLLRPARARVAPAGAGELARVAPLVASAPSAYAHLALLGDKAFMHSEDGSGFLMYGVSGRSWVAMGDPVGPPHAQRELAWRFRELADRHGGWTVFYEVTAESLPLYLDLGLRLLKLGEEALVPLREFSLEGPGRRAIRRAHRDVEKAGARFAVHPVEAVPDLLPALQRISDEWVRDKATREKGFSLGRFDPVYLARTPVATVAVAGDVVAFANLWCAPAGGELSMDLMRFGKAAPPGTMTYLMAEAMLWGRAAGYERFNLGMAPLAGFEARALAPFWMRAGAFLSRHGEHYYNFQGLRKFKDKFDPEWRPRYLASPGGLALPRILANVAALVSGGIGGVVGR